MSSNQNTQLILQYMRIVLRQQDTLINTINSMQQQNDNLYSLITDLLRQQEAAATATLLLQLQIHLHLHLLLVVVHHLSEHLDAVVLAQELAYVF